MLTDSSGKSDPFDSEKAKIELLKQEYKMAADRYENIYKAIWQIFQYVAALSAAILAFGSNALPLKLVGILSVVPLIFWYYVTFVPLNRYGDKVGRRLASIEKAFDVLVSKVSQQPKSNTLNGNDITKISLYSDFQDRLNDDNDDAKLKWLEQLSNWKFSKWITGPPRVRKRIGRFGFLYILLLLGLTLFTTSPFEKREEALIKIQDSLRVINSNQKEVLDLMRLIEKQFSDQMILLKDSTEKDTQLKPSKTSITDSANESDSTANE